MKGISLHFKETNETWFVNGNSWKDVTDKIEEKFAKQIDQDNEELSYFNFMTIDSDFVRDYDAEITIFSIDRDDTSLTFSKYLKVDFHIVHEVL